MRSRFLALVFVAALTAAVAAPSAADPVYSWRTEDGGYAFTDDPKSVPARYRDQVKVRETSGLHDYKRYTPSDSDATERYSEQLTQRLEHLRAVNEGPRAPRGQLASNAAPVAANEPTISLQSANDFEPSVEFDQGLGGEPIVVDTLFTRPAGKIVTRQSTVVRQGDKILSIVRPRLREINVATDIHDESELMD
jgi:hypothetical protein